MLRLPNGVLLEAVVLFFIEVDVGAMSVFSGFLTSSCPFRLETICFTEF